MTDRQPDPAAEEARRLLLVGNAVRTLMGYGRGYAADLDGGRRSVEDECGLPQESDLTPEFYDLLFRRNAVAARAVEVLPKETWQVPPEVYEDDDADSETPFEAAWEELGRLLRRSADGLSGAAASGRGLWSDPGTHPLLSVLYRADVDSRRGRYGVVLLGFDDGRPLYEPVGGLEEAGSGVLYSQEAGGRVPGREPPRGRYSLSANARGAGRGPRLLYARSFPERLAPVTAWESNPLSPRYGRPARYQITLFDPEEFGGGFASGPPLGSVEVHWTRVVHVSEGEVFHAPPMRAILDNLLGLRKIDAASPEAVWKGAMHVLSLETNPQLGGEVRLTPADMKDLREMTDRVLNGQEKAMFLRGLTAKSIAPSVTDPTPHAAQQLERICVYLGCPVRVFKGSERGELASSQDDQAWNDRLRHRQRFHVTPNLVAAVVDRLVLVGSLPAPADGYTVYWPDLTSTTAAERAQVLLTRTQAYAAYSGGGVDQLVPPLEYMTGFDDLSRAEAEAVIEAAAEHADERQAEQIERQRSAAEAGAAPETPGDEGKELVTEEIPDPTDNVFCPTGAGGGVDPSCKKGAAGHPRLAPVPYSAHKPGRLSFQKSLGGSTGAELHSDAGGNKYVVKKGASPGHLLSEQAADDLYRAAGAPVPMSKTAPDPQGNPVKVSRYLEGHKTLGEYEAGATPEQKQEVYSKLAKHALTDVLLGNWDVVGLGKDNVLVSPNGTPVRADNGGALSYRAKGEKKMDTLWEKGSIFTDLKRMSDPAVNPGAAAILKAVPATGPNSLQDQAQKLWDKRETILAAVTDPATKAVLEKRLSELKSMGAVDGPGSKPQPSPATPTPPPPAASPSPLATPSGLAGYVKSSASPAGAKWTDLHLKKLAWLNPQGLAGGQVYVAKTATPESDAAQLAHLKAVLPAGTTIKKVNVTDAGMAAGPFDPTKLKMIGKPEQAAGSSQPVPAPAPPKPPSPSTPLPSSVIAKQPLTLPPAPTFLSSNKTAVAQNEAAVESVKKAAKAAHAAGDAAGLEAHPAKDSISPKVKEYYAQAVMAVKLSLSGPAAAGLPADKTFQDLVSPPAPDAVKKQVSDHGAAALKAMDKATRKVIKSYTGSWYGKVNAQMRSCPPDFGCLTWDMAGQMRKMIKALDDAPPLPAVTQVYRGIHASGGTQQLLAAEYTKAMGAGAEIRLPSFTSTTLKESTAVSFGVTSSTGVMYDIKAKRGLYVQSISAHSESEIIKSPSDRYRVVEVIQAPGKPLFVKLEEV